MIYFYKIKLLIIFIHLFIFLKNGPQNKKFGQSGGHFFLFALDRLICIRFGGPLIAQVKGPKFKPKQRHVAFHHMVFHPDLLTDRQDTCQARLIESERSSVEEEQAPKTDFSLSGKELRIRKVGEGKGKTIHLQLFGLLSDRFLGLLHCFKLIIAVSVLLHILTLRSD